MFKLDNEFLTSLGLGGLPVDEKNKLLQMIYERLEMNVGMRLAEKMTDQQLDEFEAFIDQNDEAGALKWLETNFPNYKDVVAEELEKLKVEVTAAAPQILAAQGGVSGQPQVPPVMAGPAMQGVPEPQSIQQPVAPAPQPAFQAPQPFTPQQQPQPFYSEPSTQPEPVQPMQQPSFSAAPQPEQPLQPYAPEPPAYSQQSQPSFGSTPQPASPSPAYAPMQQPVPPVSAQQFNPAPQPAPGFQPNEPSQQPFGQTQGQQFTPPPAGFTPPPSSFTPGQ